MASAVELEPVPAMTGRRPRAARERHAHPPAAPPRARRGDGGRACARAARHGLARAALPHPHLEPLGSERADEFGVHAAREERVAREAGPEVGERQAREVVVHEHDAVRVPHREAGDRVAAPLHLERAVDDLAVRGDGNPTPVPHRPPHGDGDARHAAGAVEERLDRLHARVGLDAQRLGAHQPAVADELGEPADAVAAHLGAAPVGVVDRHAAVGLAVRGREEEDEAVRADAAAAVAEARRERRGVAREARARVDVDEVVRRPVELREAQRGHGAGPDPYNALRCSVNRARLDDRGARPVCIRPPADDSLRPMFLTPAEAALVRDRFGTPCYVYDRAALEAAARAALAFPHAFGFTLRYAMKANSNRAVLRLFRDLGLHVDASSDPEPERALRAGFAPASIQLTSQVPSPRLEEFVARGILYNACSLHQLDRYGRAFAGRDVTIRVNPGLGSGSTRRTNTGGPASSFGIWH